MNRKQIILIAGISTMILLGSGCSKQWKTYTVKAGKHSRGIMSKLLFGGDKITFEFVADSSWYYPSTTPSGWNKIRGLSQGHHHNNSSARLAYQCLKDSILVIGAYCYVDGVSPQQNQHHQKGIIDTIQPGIVYHCSIYRKNSLYYIDFQDKSWVGPAGKNIKWGYRLNPYVGGDFTFDHDWNIKLRDL